VGAVVVVPLLSSSQAKDLDLRTQKEFHISGETLMKRAGEKAAEHWARLYPQRSTKVGVRCGCGNNAGDGVVMGLALQKMGYKNIRFYMLFSPSLWRPELKTLTQSLAAGEMILVDEKHVGEIVANETLIDAVFGIGLSRNVDDSLAKIFKLINQSNIPVVALDIASGLNADTGEVMGAAIRCLRTFTFGWAKLGHFLRFGREYSGPVTRIDIGFPQELSRELAKYFLIRKQDVSARLPVRTALGNKTNYGHVKVWAGSPGFLGARVLTSRAAFRVGVGYVTVETDEKNIKSLPELPEALTKKYQRPEDKYTYAVGPGLGVGEDTKSRIEELYGNKIHSVVLDADALTVIAQYQLPVLPSWILTPHTGELSRLLDGTPSSEIEQDRVKHVQKAARKYGCAVLLKGYRSLLAQGERVYLVPTGNSALAKAGSGDVLTGMIAGFMAQGLDAVAAGICGAYVHGKVADRWIHKNDIRGLTPSDLLVEIPKVLRFF
jgi:NAD(P)H-hydrate epimerase